jgi:hypothetical protein
VAAPCRQGSRGLNPAVELGPGGGQSSQSFKTSRYSESVQL